LNANGTTDNSFTAFADGEVLAIAAHPNGGLVVGGNFSHLNGKVRRGLAMINSDGSLNESFDPEDPETVGITVSLIVQPDGKILGPEILDTFEGRQRYRVVRLNSDGTWDNSFALPEISAAGGGLTDMTLQTDGRTLISGRFRELGGQERWPIARLNADGTLDTSFNPKAIDSPWSVTLQPDGKVVLYGGIILSLGGLPRFQIGRLNNTEPATDALSFSDSAITWLRGGTGPEVWRTTFELSTNGSDWMMLGPGTRIPGGWQLANLALSPNSTIRARGFVNDGSSWFVEATASTPTSAPTFQSASVSSGVLTIALTVEPGQALQVQYKNNLSQPTWTNLGSPITATNSSLMISDSTITDSKRFYRVNLLP
jgi:uncharacterized delta-60 repeat protein